MQSPGHRKEPRVDHSAGDINALHLRTTGTMPGILGYLHVSQIGHEEQRLVTRISKQTYL